ncbi:hypothetical protein P154DRAFT_261329 [Amniculicola lignicola CBS 123094]|uniref:Uncharacterized protein n=1 Tax=Amniculicola lignicola CBS 123094 TaxID=1392246 RepID=A0A6A5W947_9PLEO|nr:hypothetical protein P154DRAFT_261329 [Amniculicola lignicola CBS 123094]
MSSFSQYPVRRSLQRHRLHTDAQGVRDDPDNSKRTLWPSSRIRAAMPMFCRRGPVLLGAVTIIAQLDDQAGAAWASESHTGHGDASSSNGRITSQRKGQNERVALRVISDGVKPEVPLNGLD